jgi:membrane associated rhomboid family serine protease
LVDGDIDLEVGIQPEASVGPDTPNDLVPRVSSLWTTQTDATPGRFAYACYYMLLFFAYFFGASSFDHNDDGQFDPEDVQAYLQDKGIMKRNFKRVKRSRTGDSLLSNFSFSKRSSSSLSPKSETSQAEIVVSGNYVDSLGNTLALSQSGSAVEISRKGGAASATIKEGVLEITLEGKKIKGTVQANGDIMFSPTVVWKRGVANTPAVEVASVATGGRSRNFLKDVRESVNTMTVDQIIKSTAISAGGLTGSEESFIWEVTVKRQVWPKFTILQALAIVILWVVGIVLHSAPDPMGLAGLESFWPGTSLRLTGYSCEEYRHEVYRWLLYQFTHVGVMHVSMNATTIILLGIPLEGSLGTLRMFTIFNLGVFGGAMCYMVGDGHEEVVGASGGIRPPRNAFLEPLPELAPEEVPEAHHGVLTRLSGS